MCPMRFILVFFSAILAGYFAWRTVRSSPEDDTITGSESFPKKHEEKFDFKKAIVNSFWVFVDMASGRYLWRNLREMKGEEKVKAC